jgi:hypothetical protein
MDTDANKAMTKRELIDFLKQNLSIKVWASKDRIVVILFLSGEEISSCSSDFDDDY